MGAIFFPEVWGEALLANGSFEVAKEINSEQRSIFWKFALFFFFTTDDFLLLDFHYR